MFALTYLVMFAIPLLARGEQPTWGVRAAALSGLLMTLLYAALSIFPIIDVPDPWLFTIKIVAVVGGLQCAGAVYYRWKTLASTDPAISSASSRSVRGRCSRPS